MALRWIVPGRLGIASISDLEEVKRSTRGRGTLVMVSSGGLDLKVEGLKVRGLNPELIYQKKFEELIEALKGLDPEEPLVFCCRSGMIAAPIAAAAYLVFIGWTVDKAVAEISSKGGGVVSYSSIKGILKSLERHLRGGED